MSRTYFAALFHTVNPGQEGISEVHYPGYARVPITLERGPRGLIPKTVATGDSEISFPEAQAPTAFVASHFAIAEDVQGEGIFLCIQKINPPILIAEGITPRIVIC